MNIDELEPYDCYLISLDRLDTCYINASNLFEQLRYEIEWNGKTGSINQIPEIYNSLEKSYKDFCKYHNNVKKHYNNLNDYQKEIFNQNKNIGKVAKAF